MRKERAQGLCGINPFILHPLHLPREALHCVMAIRDIFLPLASSLQCVLRELLPGKDGAGFVAQVGINVPLLGLFARGCGSERHFTLQISNLSCKPPGSSEQSRRLGGQERGMAG